MNEHQETEPKLHVPSFDAVRDAGGLRYFSITSVLLASASHGFRLSKGPTNAKKLAAPRGPTSHIRGDPASFFII